MAARSDGRARGAVGRRGGAILTVLATAVLLVGCASTPHHRTERLLTAAGSTLDGARTTLSGDLGYNDRGCVVIRSSTVIVAPAGSRLIDDGIITIAPTSQHPHDRELHIGNTAPQSVEGVLVERGSPLLPKGADCGSGPYLVMD